MFFRSKSEKELIDVILDLQKRGIDTSALVTQEDKEEFWEAVTSELLLEKESLDKLKETDPFEVLLKSKSGLPLPNWSSIVSGLQKPKNPPHISSSSSSAPTTTVHPPVMAAPARYHLYFLLFCMTFLVNMLLGFLLVEVMNILL